MNLILVLLAFVAADTLAMIPITPGGLGFVEAGLTGVLALAGVSAEHAVLATLLYRLFSYWLPLPAGLVASILFGRRHPGTEPGTVGAVSNVRFGHFGPPDRGALPVRCQECSAGRRCAVSVLGVMGVVNVTPDSFSDGGRYLDPDAAIRHGLALIAEGADVLDIGGESTRPGAEPVSEAEDTARVCCRLLPRSRPTRACR